MHSCQIKVLLQTVLDLLHRDKTVIHSFTKTECFKVLRLSGYSAEAVVSEYVVACFESWLNSYSTPVGIRARKLKTIL